MKLLTSLIITIALAAPLLAQTPTPSPNLLEAQVQHELNEAARTYRDGKFAEAQAHSERALLLDPQNKTAPFFVARTLHAQFKPGDFSSENVAKARQAIMAYQRILDRIPNEEEAYKAIARLYSDLKEDELHREWLLKRAVNESVANDKRAEAYATLASKDWNCSFNITELPTNKVTTVKENIVNVRYRMPKERVEFERARDCASRGLEMANVAITLAPEDDSGWRHKTNNLLELSKLAEMLGEVQQKRELQRQYEEALNETKRLVNRVTSNP